MPLAAAEACLDRARSVPGPFTAYPRAGLEYQRAQTLIALGLPTEAMAALRASARQRAPERRRALAITEFRLGQVLLSAGHLVSAYT